MTEVVYVVNGIVGDVKIPLFENESVCLCFVFLDKLLKDDKCYDMEWYCENNIVLVSAKCPMKWKTPYKNNYKQYKFYIPLNYNVLEHQYGY